MPQVTVSATGEYLPDLPDRGNPGVTLAKNVIPLARSYGPFRSHIPDVPAIAERCRGATPVKNNSGAVFNLAGDRTTLYERVGGAYAAQNSTYLTPDNRNWEFASWENFAYAANGQAAIQSTTLGSGTWADLTNAPIANHIAQVRNFLVAGGTSADAKLVKWSGIADPTEWTPGTLQSGEQPLRAGGDIQRVVGGEYGLVFCENAIYRMTYVGAPIVWQFDEVVPGRGTREPGSVVQIGYMVYFIGPDGFYEFNGATINPIGSNKLNRTFLADYDPNFRHRVTSAIDLDQTLIFWAYPGTGHDAEGTPNKIMVYNWTTGRFSGPIEQEVEVLVYSLAPPVLSDTSPYPGDENVDTGTVANLLSDAQDFKGGGSSALAAFNTDHEHGLFSGTPLTAMVDSAEMSLNPGGLGFLKGVRPLVDGESPTVTVDVGIRNVPHGTITWEGPKAPFSANGVCNFRAKDRFHRVRLNVSGEFRHIYGGEVEWTPGGRK